MCRSTPAFRWFPGTLFLSSRWEFGGPARGCLRRRQAGGGGLTLLPAPLWFWEAGRGVSSRATAAVGWADSRDSRGPDLERLAALRKRRRRPRRRQQPGGSGLAKDRPAALSDSRGEREKWRRLRRPGPARALRLPRTGFSATFARARSAPNYRSILVPDVNQVLLKK